MKKHQHNHKRILIAVLILLSVIFMIAGPRAKAGSHESSVAASALQHNVHIVTIIKSIIIS